MDDTQVQSWRDGDAMAAAAVRNGLRAVADAIVTAPLGSAAGGRTSPLVRDPDRRREVTAEVAREVMQRGGATAADLRALAVMVAARHVVDVQREGRHLGDASHLPPQMVVSMALAEDSLSGHARDVARRHVDECTGCAGDVEMVAAVVKRVMAGAAAPAPRPPPSSTADAPTEETVRPAARPVPDRSSPPRRSPAPRSAGGPIRPPRGGRLDRPATVSPWRAAWPVIAILVVVAGLFMARTHTDEAAAAVPELAAIADRSVPDPPAAGDLPDDVDSVVQDLQTGNCRVAAARLQRARKLHEGDLLVAWYDARAQVCAGNGDAAMEAFDAYRQAGGESTPELLYYQAQAALLRGDLPTARQQLLSARPLVDSDLGATIDAQLDQLTRI